MDSPARDAFRVTTPAEAGIAFLDGPRLGGYDAEPEEIVERPAPRPQPVAVSAPAPEPARESPRAEAPAPPRVTPPGVHSHDETPEERERRLRASKTETVEVVKTEGEPAKRGWWRKGG